MIRFLLVVILISQPLAGFGMEPNPSSPVPETSSLFSMGIRGYQKLFSPVLDSKCYMQPSCSVYGSQALSEYGPWLGLLMTIDRLFHEANEDQTSPLVRQGNTLKLYDPPRANVWWK
jgi:putative component of membrane protein insertase Oxa1/YidC/SpoIIIJ protein YidD